MERDIVDRNQAETDCKTKDMTDGDKNLVRKSIYT